jgi:hypothetical protein
MTDPGKKGLKIFKKKATATGGGDKKGFLKKKSDPVAASVNKQFSSAQGRADQRFAKDLGKEKAIQSGASANAKKDLPQGKLDGMGGGKTNATLTIGRSHAGKENAGAAVGNLLTRKQSTEYNAAPHVKGGTKKQVKGSFLRQKSKSGSPQQKASMKRAFGR